MTIPADVQDWQNGLVRETFRVEEGGEAAEGAGRQAETLAALRFMFGRGRPGKSPTIDGVEELRPEDLDGLKRGRAPAVKNLKDSHHLVARLLAIGLRPGEVAERAGYSRVRISILQADPSFQELVQHYRTVEAEAFIEARDDYYDMATKGRVQSARQMLEQLDEADESGEKIPLNTLLRIHDSLADRTGYGKRSTQVNINVDFAARLERAVKASRDANKVIEGTVNK